MDAAVRSPGKSLLIRRIAPFAADLVDNWELLRQFTLRNFELTLKGSHLGLIWSFLNPLLLLGLYVYVFGYIFPNHFGVLPDETRVDFALGLFLGLTFLGFVADSMAAAPVVITSNPNFVKKVIFPLEILPAASVGAAFLRMLISLLLTLAGAALLGRGVHWGWLWLLVILPPFCLSVLGMSWLFSALGVFVQDLTQFVGFLIQVTMYASAVFYPPTRISPAVWQFLRFNPVLLVVDLGRNAVLWQRALNVNQLIYLYACGLACSFLGHLAFQRLRPAFADVL
jgi:lipopolysaccharide transport system permease protein